MARILAIANQKGGVGKTTTTVNLVAALARTKRKVLMVDLDPQGNATMGVGIDKETVENSVTNVLLDEMPARQAIQKLDRHGFWVLPANADLTAAEVGLVDVIAREQVLNRALSLVKDEFDYILIDCPPALNLLTLNALAAADGVLVPMQCEYYAMEGLAALLGTIDKIKTALNERLELEGILRTMYDPRNNLSNDVSEQLVGHFGDKVFRTQIPRNVRLAEAPSYGLPIIEYDRNSKGAQAYLALAGELLRRAR